MALDRLRRHAFDLGFYDRNQMPMSKPEIKHLTDFALFLPFSHNERRQTAANQCKARTLEVIEKMKKTALYG